MSQLEKLGEKMGPMCESGISGAYLLSFQGEAEVPQTARLNGIKQAASY